jgi:hypothetical protein
MSGGGGRRGGEGGEQVGCMGGRGFTPAMPDKP